MIERPGPTEGYLLGIARWGLAAVLHPVATFKAAMLIGDEKSIDRNFERAFSLPKLPRGRQRLQK